MKEHAIMFSAPMVRAILEGRKTQTRRVQSRLRYNLQRGDRLWVRENFRAAAIYDDVKPRDLQEAGCASVNYEADGRALGTIGKLRPSIYLPRWASRITLEVTGLRFEHVQRISEEDAAGEGMPEPYFGDGDPPFEEPGQMISRAMQFRNLWKVLNDKPGVRWEDNPFVIIIDFKRI